MKNGKIIISAVVAIAVVFVLVSLPPSLVQTLSENKQYFYATIGIGTSMEPTIHNGDTLIIMQKSDPSFNISFGDIVVYHDVSCGCIVAHRVIYLDTAFYRVKGDNAPEIKTVTHQAVIGKVVDVVDKNNILGNTLVNAFLQ